MKFAVNYSAEAVDLYDAELIKIDLFKTPAWTDLVTAIQENYPLYVHFPLLVGSGIGDAINAETGKPADWERIEVLLAQSNTPLINLHLAPTTENYPDIPIDSTDPAHMEMLTERTIRDVLAVTERFGPQHVIVENIPGNEVNELKMALRPELISEVIESAGCGFLFDLSHAQLAAHYFGMDIYKYIQELPVERIREIHVNGIHRLEGRWLDLAQEAGFDEAMIQRFSGQLMDHLPMSDADWTFFTWAMAQIEAGKWGRPWVVTFEYGGVGPLYERTTERAYLANQIPRFYKLIKGVSTVATS